MELRSEQDLFAYASRLCEEVLGDRPEGYCQGPEAWNPELAAWFKRYDAVVNQVGAAASWDEDLLRRAAGPELDLGETQPRSVLITAAISARQRAEPVEERAHALASSTLLGAWADPRGLERWAETLAKHSYGQSAALERAEALLPWVGRGRDRAVVEGAREMIGEAKRLLESVA